MAQNDRKNDEKTLEKNIPKIYTKKGDKGITNLYGNKLPKFDDKIHVLGDIDELNAFLGLAREYCEDIQTIYDFIPEIQRTNMLMSEEIAKNSNVQGSHEENPSILYIISFTTTLEQNIDMITQEMPPLQKFILPGNDKGASFLHICRTVCRRAERSLVKVVRNEHILTYINRLSDLLFTIARYACFKHNKKEVIYEKNMLVK